MARKGLGLLDRFCRLRGILASGMHRVLLIILIGVFVAAILISFRLDQDIARPSNESYLPAELHGDLGKAVVVKTGIFVNRLHDMSISAGTFSANGWLWMSWDKPGKDDWHRTRKLDIGSIDLINEIPGRGQLERLDPEPTASDVEGRLYHSIRFSSVFLMEAQDFRRFPFEKIRLPIEVGTDDHPTYRMIFVPDEKDSMISDRVNLPGYRYEGLKYKNFFYTANTLWGHEMPAGESESEPLSYPQLEWELNFRRSTSSSFVRLFLPLGAAMAALLFSLLSHFKVSVQKISIPASILLVLAVLQDRWHRVLPPGLAYLTYMDKLFIFAYVVTVIVFAHSVFCVNLYHSASEERQALLSDKMRHQQRRLASAICCGLLVGPIVLWFV